LARISKSRATSATGQTRDATKDARVATDAAGASFAERGRAGARSNRSASSSELAARGRVPARATTPSRMANNASSIHMRDSPANIARRCIPRTMRLSRGRPVETKRWRFKRSSN
jgi:hypothetical protein